MKFKINDVIRPINKRLSYKGLIINTTNNQYTVKWTDYSENEDIRDYGVNFIDTDYILDKEYIWNEEMKDIINEI